MNKIWKRISMALVGMAMAVGVGVAIGSGTKAMPVYAADTTDTYVFTATNWSSKLNNEATAQTNYWDVDQAVGNGYSSTQGLQFTTNNASSYIGTTTIKSYVNVSSIVVTYSTNASKGAGTIKTQVGDGTAQTFSVTKPASNGTTDKTTTFTFDNESGVVGLYAQCTANSVYIKSIAITYNPVSFGTLDHIKITTNPTKTEYEVGDTFSSAGIAVYAYDGENEATAASKNITTSVTYSGYNLNETGNQTVTVSYTENAINKTTSYGITVNAAADFVLDGKDNAPAGVTSSTNTTTGEGQVNSSGVKYGYYALQTYNSNLEFNRATTDAYIGNNESYEKYINKISITLAADNFDKLTLYKGDVAIPGSTSISPNENSGLTRTFDLGNDCEYFSLKQTTTGTWIQIVQIKIYLGSTVESAVVSDLEIAEPGSVYVGKTLQLSATVTYTNKPANSKVTWAVTNGNGATVDDAGVVTAIAATATTITATTIEKDENGNAVTKSVTITPLDNPIVSVSWDTSNAKTTYNVGDELDIGNITATGTNAAGDDDVAIELEASNFSGFDSSAPVESQTITITYLTFTTTYTIRVVKAPDVSILPTDFSGTYADNNGTMTFDGINFTVNQMSKQNAIQMQTNNGYIYNTDPLGSHITSVEISVNSSSVNVYLGTDVLDSNEGLQTVSVSNNDGVKIITPDAETYQYLRVSVSGSTPKLDYIKIWYAPFTPTVTLDQTAFNFTEGDTGEIEVNATATHFTSNASVEFAASSSNESVLANEKIEQDGGYFLIAKSDVNPGTTTITITGTYSAKSEQASASFTITCVAAERDLNSIAITTASSDTVFTEGDKFTITDLVVTGTFSAEPTTADVTEGCTFKLWDGESETALVPGTTVLSTGNFTVRISHPDSLASETLTYTIKVNEIPYFTKAASQSDLYEGSKVIIASVSGNSVYTAGAISGDYLSKVDGSSKEGSSIYSGTGTLVFTVRYYGSNILLTSGNLYLKHNGDKKLAFTSSIDENCVWSYDGSALTNVANSSFTLQYNSSNPRFTDYSSSQTAVGLYVSSESAPTDAMKAETFAYKYLHLRDYTSSAGSCLSTEKGGLGYYDAAYEAYVALSDEVKAEFAKLNDAVARFENWATANGYTFNATSKTFTENAKGVFNFTTSEQSSNLAIILVSAITALVIAGGTALMINKRKEN